MVVFAVVGAVASLAFELMFAGGVFLNHEWTRMGTDGRGLGFSLRTVVEGLLAGCFEPRMDTNGHELRGVGV